MSRKLILELPDDAYESLVQSGQEKGESPEALASRILTVSFTDPLLRLSGCIKTSIKDIAEHHDKYLGRAILETDEE